MQNFFKSALLFAACFGFGIITLIRVTPDDRLVVQETDLSSMAATSLYRYDYDLSAISDAAVDQELQQLNSNWYSESSAADTNYVYTPEQLQRFDDDFNALPAAPTAALTRYEKPASCGGGRMWVEKKIFDRADLKDLMEERPESSSLPRSCVAYIMNSSNMRPQSYAKCSERCAEPIPGGVKPCSTKNLVNLTYNTYLDVMECFDFNPKNILPKLANESGLVLNTLGGGFDAGVAQFTKSGIDIVNVAYADYMRQMEVSVKPACKRLAAHKPLLMQAGAEKKERCEFVVPGENPLRSFVYSAILNDINEKQMKTLFERHHIESRIKNLGFTEVNIESLIEAMAYMSYNSGSSVAFNAVKSYVSKREAEGLKLTASDFDFTLKRKALDIDNVSKDVLQIARSFAGSPFIYGKESQASLTMKKNRVKLLPEKIRTAYRLSFPEHLIYKQNNFNEADQIISADYRMLGAPGYINFLLKKNEQIRAAFTGFGVSADYCSNPNYLKMTK